MLPRALHEAATAAARSGKLKEKTALVLIEMQNHFLKAGGGSYPVVKDELERLNVIPNTIDLVRRARALGVPIVWAPITYNDDYSDLPQRDFGAMAGAADRGGFKRSEWDGAIIDELAPLEGEVVLQKKTGLCAFAQDSELEAVLAEQGIENIAVGGMLTNCCVESTVRTAYEKGYKVITLSECTATTDAAAHEASLEPRKGRLNFFSNLMANDEFFAWLSRPVAGSTAPAGGLGVTGISHLNVVVPDVEEAKEYYMRLLGFEQAVNDGGEMNYKTITGSRKKINRFDDCGGFFRDAGFSGDDVEDAVVDVLFLRHPTCVFVLRRACARVRARVALSRVDVVERKCVLTRCDRLLLPHPPPSRGGLSVHLFPPSPPSSKQGLLPRADEVPLSRRAHHSRRRHRTVRSAWHDA